MTTAARRPSYYAQLERNRHKLHELRKHYPGKLILRTTDAAPPIYMRMAAQTAARAINADTHITPVNAPHRTEPPLWEGTRKWDPGD